MEQNYDAHVITFAIVPHLAFWIAAYFSSGGKDGFDKSIWPCFHAVAVVIIASLSLYFDDEAVVREELVLLFSRSFFIVDLWSCIMNRDVPFTIHAVLGILINMVCHYSGMHYEMRSASKGLLVELSTPLYYWWKNTKKKSVYILFVVIFFACRILWLPIVIWKTYLEIGPFHWLMKLLSTTLCILQGFFFEKMVRILWNYKDMDK